MLRKSTTFAGLHGCRKLEYSVCFFGTVSGTGTVIVRAELAVLWLFHRADGGTITFRTWFRGVSDIMPPTTRRGSRVDRTLDLGNDVMANILCSFASAQDVLNSRCVCTAWRDLIAMPGILLGCTACNHCTVYVDASHLRAFFWVKVLGTNCTSLTFQASEEACRRVQSEALMLPGLAPHLPFPALDLPLLTECLVRCPNLTSLSIKCCSLEPNIAWEDLLRALMVSPRLGHMLTSLKLSHESFGSLTKGHLRKIARAMPNLASVDVPFDFGHIPLVVGTIKNMRNSRHETDGPGKRAAPFLRRAANWK